MLLRKKLIMLMWVAIMKTLLLIPPLHMTSPRIITSLEIFYLPMVMYQVMLVRIGWIIERNNKDNQ